MRSLIRIAIISFVAAFISCEDFLNVNETPNSHAISTLPLKAKLTAALVSTVNQESLQLNKIGALWGGYW